MILEDEDINSMSLEALADNLSCGTLLLEATIDSTRDVLTDCSDKAFNLKRMARVLEEKLKEQGTNK